VRILRHAVCPQLISACCFLGEPGLGADLLSHEATFSAAEAGKAEVATHSTAGMAGAFAAQLGARHLVLTHFSARYGPGRPRYFSVMIPLRVLGA